MEDEFIYPEELAAKLDRKDDVIIVDVRDEDRGDSWIRGATHMPSRYVTASSMTSFAGGISPTHLVVFHCMFSQTRGPRARNLFEKFAPAGRRARSVILAGGFVQFEATYLRSRP